MKNILSYGKSISISFRHEEHPLLSIQQELDKMMNYFNRGTNAPVSSDRFENLRLRPSIDIVDHKDHFKVEIEMPGMAEENIKILISDGMLTIKGEKEEFQQKIRVKIIY